MNMDKYTGLFVSLGERLSGFGGDAASRGAIAAAMNDNPWFTTNDIMTAVEAIRTRMLQPGILSEWLGRYDTGRCARAKDIAVIMAGNIPLVGFSDLLCVVAAGDRCHLKMSGKDSALMKYVTDLLKDADPAVQISDYHKGGRYDAVIATGSDNTNRYFRSAFSGIPSLLRGSRSSVAIIDGGEPADKLGLLSRDIFGYSGLGCRNTSLVFVPRDYDIDRLGRAVTPAAENVSAGYINNYVQNRALLSVKGEAFADFGCFLMQEKDSFPMNISSVNYCRYNRTEEVGRWLDANDGEVQCVVAENFPHRRGVAFGQAHYPYPWDYPDGRDVMAFLGEL
jgi:hypothetical protein